MTFQTHRPQGYTGLGDHSLPRIINELTQVLNNAQRQFTYDTLTLPDREWANLAHVLVEFAEDIHAGLGIWRSLERYNLEFFGTPLPLILPSGWPAEQIPSLQDRTSHLLWVLYAEIEPDLILAPTHQDLRRLAAIAADFLRRLFLSRTPKQSGIKTFLSRRNKFGWTVKQKLVWLGQHSYLFRYSFQNYVEAQGGKADIPTIDDFICQHTTAWSSLGVIDVLAALLPLKETQRAELRSWHERHAAFYRVIKAGRSRLKLLNLINDEPYTVRMDNNGDLFQDGQIVFGSLAPWQGQWYWSGEQSTYNQAPEEAVQEMCQMMLEKNTDVVYRYDKARLEAAREAVNRVHQTFLETHGEDLAIYPDGLSMAAGMQKMYRLYNETAPEAIRSELMAKYGMASTAPNMPYPPEIIENENGVGVFFNPGEGTEIMLNFNDVTSGLKKRGLDLSEDEAFAIQQLFYSEAISPAFVRRLVQDYGDESVAEAFLIRDRDAHPYLDYLLRQHKGHFYRNRYPNVTMV